MYNQAQLLYNSLNPPGKSHVTAAFAFELDHCDDPIVYERMSQRLADIDLELAQSVAELVGGTRPSKATRINHCKKAKNLSQTEIQPTIATRRVAIIIADGFDKTVYDAIIIMLKASGAFPFTIAPRRSEIFSVGVERKPGNGVKPDHHLEGMRSTMFDAIFIPGGADSIKTLEKSGRAIHWVREAFGHLKAIGATGEAVQLLEQAFTLPEVKKSRDDKTVESCRYGVVTIGKVSPDSLKGAVTVAKEATGFLQQFWYQIAQ